MVGEAFFAVATEAIKEAGEKIAETAKEIAEIAKEGESIFPDFFQDMDSEMKEKIHSDRDSVQKNLGKDYGEMRDKNRDDFRLEASADSFDKGLADGLEEDLDETLQAYFKDLQEKSQYPDTISDKPFEASSLEKRAPEENAQMREEFDDRKTSLKREWETINGIPWPKYGHDVYSVNGKLIRTAGMDYDAHHIQPLGMGGKNEANNIAPLNAEVHYDKQGIHAPDSPYSKLDQMLGGVE